MGYYAFIYKNIGTRKKYNTMDFMQNIEDASRLLREAAQKLEEGGLLELDFEISIKLQRPRSTVTPNTDPGENASPSK